MNYKEFNELTQHLPDSTLIKASSFTKESTKENLEYAETVDIHVDDHYINVIFSFDNDLPNYYLGELRQSKVTDNHTFESVDEDDNNWFGYDELIIHGDSIILLIED